jgi:hypothetical protein
VDEEQVINQILEDEGLTSSLEEAEATRLTNTLIEQAKVIVKKAKTEDEGWTQIKALRQRARKIARVVATFRDDGPEKAKLQAQQDKLPWPSTTPTTSIQLLEQLSTIREGS